MEANKRTEFMALRKAGVPPTQIPAEIAEPLVERVMNAPAEQLFKVGEVCDYQWQEASHTFESVVCEECGEMVVERNARVQGDECCASPAPGWAESVSGGASSRETWVGGIPRK
jgi:formylmethanofuran dehydrogenase subunit E